MRSISSTPGRKGSRFLRIHPKALMRRAREGKVPAYSFSEGTVLPTQPGQFTAPQTRSHIPPHRDPLAREPGASCGSGGSIMPITI
jgi:hypothetical protein